MTKEQFMNGFKSAFPYIGVVIVQISFIANDEVFNEMVMMANLGVSSVFFYLECLSI